MLRKHVRALAEHLEGAQKGHASDVHQARVASRRLREALPVAARAVPDGGGSSARRQVRRVTVALGGVREMDVARETLAALREQHAWAQAVVRRVEKHLDRERRHRGRRMHEALTRVAMPRLEAAIMTIASDLEERPAAGWSQMLAARVRRRVDRFEQALEQVGTLYAADRLHGVRIAAKKLRYTLELASKATRLPVGREIGRLKRAQELLGHLHDFQILQAHVQEVAAAAASDVRLTRALGSILATCETECRTLHATFVARRTRLMALPARVRQEVAQLREAPEVPRGTPARMLTLGTPARKRRALSA